MIKQRLPQTLQVVGSAYLIAVLIAVPIGIVSAVKQYTVFDHTATFGSFVGFSVPSFFTGLLLMLIFAINLGWFPIVYNSTIEVTNWQTLWQQVRQMILPVTVLVVQQTGAMTRFMRSSMLENLPRNMCAQLEPRDLRSDGSLAPCRAQQLDSGCHAR